MRISPPAAGLWCAVRSAWSVGAQAGVVLAAFLSAASAQEVIEPSPEPSPLTSPSPSPHSRWAVHAVVQEVSETNPAHAAGDDVGSWGTSVRAGVLRAVETPRARLSVSGEGSAHWYHQLPTLNETTWLAAAAGELRTSLRGRLRFDEMAASTYARDLQSLLDSGMLPPTAVVLRFAGSAEYAHRLSATATLSGWAQHELVSVDSPVLRDGGEWSLGSTATFGIGPRQTLGLSVSRRHSQAAAEGRAFYASAATWKATPGRRLTTSAMLGFVYGRFEEKEHHSFEPEGRATLALALRRLTLLASYTRLVGEAFGYEVQRRSDVVSAGVEWRPAPRVGVAGGSSYGSSRRISGPAFDVRTRSHFADLRWTPAREVTLSGGYSYLRRNTFPDPPPPTSSHGLRLTVSVGREWP